MKRNHWLITGAAVLLTVPAVADEKPLTEINLFGDDYGRGNDAAAFWINAPNTPEAAKSPYGQVLTCTDGSQLHGKLEKITESEIFWGRPDGSAVLRFQRGEVRRVLTRPSSPAEIAEWSPGAPVAPDVNSGKGIPATVKLAGGDWVFGDVTNTDDRSFSIEDGDDLHVTVLRSQIEWMYFDPHPVRPFGFGGSAQDMEGWTPSTATFKSVAGTLEVSESPWISHKTLLPRRFEIAFEAPEGSGIGLRLWLEPFASPQPGMFTPGTVSLQFGKKQVTFTSVHGGNIDRQNADLPKEARDETGPVSYRIFYDSVDQRMAVRRNGQPVAEWTVKEEVGFAGYDGKIRGVCFQRGAGKTGLMKFNRLTMRPWNGVLPPESGDSNFPEEISTGHAAAVEGKLEKIGPNKLIFSGQSRPRQEDTLVQFANAPAGIEHAEAKLNFGRHGLLTARRFSVQDGKIRGETAFDPELEMPIGGLHEISFTNLGSPPIAGGDVLVFTNGDELAGHALAAAQDGPVRWKLSSGTELEIQPERIAGIRLAVEPGQSKIPAATVELRSGERLRGKVTALDEKQIRLENEHLGTLTLERSRVWHLYPNPQDEVLDGACEPGEWMGKPAKSQNKNRGKVSSAKSWLYMDGKFVQRRSDRGGFDINPNSENQTPLFRNLPPDLERFELRVQACCPFVPAANLNFQLESKDCTMNASVGWSGLNIGIYRPNSRNNPQRPVWRQVALPEKVGEPSPRLEVRVFVDLTSGTCDLVVNGALAAHTGHDPAERLPKGNYSLTLSTNQIDYEAGDTWLPNILSDIWIGPWNGELPQAPELTGATTALANGDVTAGAPDALHEGRWSLDSDLGHLDLPLEKVVAVDFGGTMEPVRPAARLRLTDGTAVNLDTFSWDGHELNAHSATCGDMRLPLGAIAELIYNPAPPHAPMTFDPKKLPKKIPDGQFFPIPVLPPPGR